jgi:hypothetical protein
MNASKVAGAPTQTQNANTRGQQPLVLHAYSLPKPWQFQGVWLRKELSGSNVYLRFLRRTAC